MTRDKLIYSESSLSLTTACYICHKGGHYANNCPLLHYVPDKELIILKYNTPIKKR